MGNSSHFRPDWSRNRLKCQNSSCRVNQSDLLSCEEARLWSTVTWPTQSHAPGRWVHSRCQKQESPMTLVIQKHTENIAWRDKFWVVLTSWPLKLTSGERGGVSKLQHSIKTTDDGVHLSIPVTVSAIFSLFSVLLTLPASLLINWGFAQTGSQYHRRLYLLHQMGFRGSLAASQELLYLLPNVTFTRWTVEGPQHFCANWWFYESWERPESGRASGHNNPPQGGQLLNFEFGPEETRPRQFSFVSPSCRNSWKITPVLEVQHWCSGFAFHQNTKAERVSDVGPTLIWWIG